MRGRVLRACALAAALLVGAGGVQAQTSLTARCTEQVAAADLDFCNTLAQAVEIALPRVGIAASGGNATLGSASTLGFRLGSMPRVAITPRVTVGKIHMPPIAARNGDEVDALLPVVALDASVGIFQGISLLPTVGGFGSLDLLASMGRVLLPGDEGFDSGATTWAAGAHVGILRESFTAPGVSVSGMYRRVGDVVFGDPDVTASEGYFLLDDLRAWSLRGTVGKRFLMFSATAGLGHDWYGSDAQLRFATDDPAADGARTIQDGDYRSQRLTAFGNLAFTVVIVSLTGELGWQQGAEGFTGPGATDLLEKDGWYGGIGLRLTF